MSRVIKLALVLSSLASATPIFAAEEAGVSPTAAKLIETKATGVINF